MIYQCEHSVNTRSAFGCAVTPSLLSASSTSLSALRSALLREVGQWISRACSVHFTRPSCVADDELCEEEQSTRTSAKAKRRSPQAEAVNHEKKNIRRKGHATQSASFELAVRSLSGTIGDTAETLRAAFAKWVRGHAQAVSLLKASNLWRKGLSEAERKHIEGTWASLRLPGREKRNRRLVRRFQNLNEFAWWSLRSGFSLHSEIELVNPRIVRHVVAQRRSKLVWLDSGTSKFEFQLPWKFDPDSEPHEWITDYDVVWTPHHRLRSKFCPILTPYGAKRLKATKNGILRGRKSKFKYGDGLYSASELARLPEALVSDKVIAKRLAAGWSVTEAITTPAQRGGRPRKSTAENDKP